jgi:Legume lectin domain/Putative Ig domain
MRSCARFAFVGAIFLLGINSLKAQQVGPNVNMVSGTQWPGGDPFLQRQNEPSMAISSRNPLHMVAGDNDYRTVDLPFVSGGSEPTGDAWLGLFKSFDGGQTWTSTLIPGYPQDKSLAGLLSPIHGLGAGADGTVRSGTNGMFFYSGLAFNRQDGGANKVFVSTFTDDNNLEGGDSIRYLWTTAVDTGTSTLFDDKPSIAVDIPRSWSGICVVPALPLRNTQIFRAGTIYAAWTQFTGDPDSANAAIVYARSIDCGLTWSQPKKLSGTIKTSQGAALAIDPNNGALYISWREFASTGPTQPDAIMYVASYDGGSTFTKPTLVANINPFDQGDTYSSFRTNDYPTMAVDAASRVYLAWTQRGLGNIGITGGDARVVVSTGLPTTNHNPPLTWGTPQAVDLGSGRGHQIMPAMAFSAGKLTLAWYDLRNDDLLAIYNPLGVSGQYSTIFQNDGGAPDFPSFGMFIQDPAPPYSFDARRQTIDVRAAQATPGNPPVFLPSVQVSNYPYGSVPASTQIQQLQVDPPNLPMFQGGTLPFFGDYIDVAGPTFVPNQDGTWRFNNKPGDPDFTHVVWTDNRDVVPPADGNWANYTPPTYGTTTASIFDPTQQRPACTVSTTGNTGDRNQNIYTAQLAPGVVLSAPGNAKPLGKGTNGQLIQRQFPIVVANTTPQTRYYQLAVVSPPTGGAASFLQFQVAGQPFPLTQIQVQVPGLSSTSRGLFVTSSVANATVTVTATELTALNGTFVTGGQTGSVTINGDPNNPPSSNTSLASNENYTPTIANPNIANPNIANPNIANPNIANPNIANPNIANPNIANPNIANPNIANPNIANPNIANPNIANSALSDAVITDGTVSITNTGDTSGAYSVNLIGQNPPQGVLLQLIVYQNYTTPLAQNCNLGVQSHFVPVANIPNVTFATLTQLFQPAANNPTIPGLALAPGQTAYITVRAFDTTTNNPAQALLDYNPITQVSPVVVSQGANTGTTQPPVTLTVLPKTLPQATLTGAYPSQALQATGSAPYTWTIATGTPPTGITLSAAGVISGTPTGAPGTSSFTVQVKDAANNVALQPLSIVVNAAPSVTTASLSPADRLTPYSQTLAASGGTPPSAWSISVGSLPDGLSLTGSTIRGTPSNLAVTSTFTVKITDANGVAATQALTITVSPAPSITTTSVLVGLQGSAYSAQIVATGGTAPLAFTTGTVDGLILSSSGSLSGFPAAAGSFPFTAQVTDALKVSASTSLTLVVNSSLSLQSATLPYATVNFPYQPQQLVVTGGTGTYSNWTLSLGSLPLGLSLGSTGILSGTPTGVNTDSFTVSVSDGVSTATQTYTIYGGFSLVGNAFVNETGVELTSGVGQASAAWAGTQQAVGSGFTASFQFQITPVTSPPADGVAFVIQGSPSGLSALGFGGGGIGYQTVPNSLAVEFDTYLNNDSINNDPNANHVAILSDGLNGNSANHVTAALHVTNPLTNPATGQFTIADRAVHTVTITYTPGLPGEQGTLNVAVDSQPSPIVSASLDLSTLLGLTNGKAWVGFTGASGSNGEVGIISNWIFTPTTF